MLLRWVINFQFLKAKTPSQANRLFEWALLRQLCDHKASESTGIIMLLTLSTVVCSQQKWKNNQIDLSMSHVPCTTIPVDRIPEVVFSQAARPYRRHEDLSWVILKHGLFFHCPRNEKRCLKPLNERSSKFRRTRYFQSLMTSLWKHFISCSGLPNL